MSYSQLLKLDSKHANAYGNRGLARAKKGGLDGAINDYNQALKLNPKHAGVYYNRGVVKEAKKDAKQMRVYIRQHSK